MKFGTLYLVATPIGNLEDMTFRAIRVLKEADVIVYEERKEGSNLLRNFGIEKKPIESLNEHNEIAATQIIIDKLIEGRNIALISDAGTPVFSDPGQILVQRAIEKGIKIVPIPGASSLMPALIASGFSIDKFRFFGFLSPKRNRRIAELQQLRRESQTFVLMDTPYRLIQLLRDISDVLGQNRRICIAFDLTMPDEEIIHGPAGKLYHQFAKLDKRGEFVIVVEGSGG
jgi:16S rRNA (cytidine1402-2'-O)-methyltransferase